MIRADQPGLLSLLGECKSEPEEVEAAERLAVLWEVLILRSCRAGLLRGECQLLGEVLDGVLVWLPWETLVVQPGLRPLYLLDVGPPILYAPSATVLLKLAQRSAQGVQPASEPVLAIGDCIYSSWPLSPTESALLAHARAAKPSGQGSEGPASFRAFARLEHSGEEIRLSLRCLANQASRCGHCEAKRLPKRTSVNMHPAGGSSIWPATAEWPPMVGHFFGAFLALTPGRPEDSTDDGILTAQESCQLNLAGCELPILAACQTNLGPQQTGEGAWSWLGDFGSGRPAGGGRQLAAG